MNNHDDFKRLMEAVEPVKVDTPKNTYSNTPNEQVLDSATQQGFGNDLHKVKSSQYKQKDGDNPRADATIKEQARLTRAFKKLKLTEGADQWSNIKELAKMVDETIKDQGSDLSSTVTRTMFKEAIELLLAGNMMGAVDCIMGEFSDHNGGERRDHDAYAHDLAEDLQFIMDSSSIEKSAGVATAI